MLGPVISLSTNLSDSWKAGAFLFMLVMFVMGNALMFPLQASWMLGMFSWPSCKNVLGHLDFFPA